MRVKEIFYSLQGEGANTGRPAVFCRFTGCNLWSGQEKDRAKAICKFCDTDFVGGQDYTEDDLVTRLFAEWPARVEDVRVFVFTGGEPGLQLTASFIAKMKNYAPCDLAIETNGTIELPFYNVHLTVSPKHGTELKQTWGDELKVIWPQPFQLAELEALSFKDFYLQPMDGYPGAQAETLRTVLENPAWKLSLQTHKFLGIR